MSGVDPTAHNRLKMAEDRLTLALTRLETALENRAATTASSSTALSTAFTQADAELLAQAQDLQAENAKLRELVDDTAARLDGTIAKFKTTLAEQG